MPDSIDVPAPRSFRADRRLIAQLTSDPQLIRYLEALGIDNTDTIPEFLELLFGLIMDAAELAASSQGTANNASRLAQQALDESSAATGQSLPAAVLSLIQEVAGELVQQGPQLLRDVERRVDDLEGQLLDIRPPVPAAQTPPYAPTVATITTAYAVPAAPPYQPSTVRADATTAGFTVTLPAAPLPLQLVNVKKVDATANIVTISGGAINIDGGLTVAIGTQYTNLQIQYNGATWDVL